MPPNAGNGEPGDDDYVPPFGGTADVNNSVETFYVINADPLQNGVPPNECWDTYLKHGNNSNGVLDVYSAYYVSGSGNNQTQGKTAGGGYWTVGPLVNGYACASPCAYSIFSNYGGSINGNACALEYVNDVSIAVDPQRMSQLGMRMGSYTGRMNIKNWSTGASIAFGQAVKSMGNPFFTECDGGVFGDLVETVNPNPPIRQRKVHTSSHDPGDISLVKKQQKKRDKQAFNSLDDIEFQTGGNDAWKEYYDADFDFDADIANNPISDFSTDTDNLFPK